MLLMHNAFSHVFLKSGRHAERHVAKPTFELIVPHPSVGLHVPRKLAALRTGVRTQLTSVWFLARVTSPVHRQVAAVLENFSAILAGVVSSAPNQVLPCIGVEDGIKPTLLGESLDGTGFHGRHLHPHWKRWQGDVFQAGSSLAQAAPSSPSNGWRTSLVRVWCLSTSNARHPKACKQVLLLSCKDRGRRREGGGRRVEEALRWFRLELPDVVVHVLLQPPLPVFLLGFPVRLLVLLDVVEAKLVHQLPYQGVGGSVECGSGSLLGFHRGSCRGLEGKIFGLCNVILHTVHALFLKIFVHRARRHGRGR